MSGIDAVLFDADGVLQHARPGWRELLEGIGGPSLVADLFVAERGPLVGTEPMADAVSRVLAAHGLPVDPTPVLRAWEYVELDPEAVSVVTGLRRAGVACHLASNQQDHRIRYMTQTLSYGDLLDELFFSAELGVAKPDAAFFTLISDRLAVAPQRLVFIDDVEANVAAARSVGLRAERHDPASGASGLQRLLRRHGLGRGVEGA